MNDLIQADLILGIIVKVLLILTLLSIIISSAMVYLIAKNIQIRVKFALNSIQTTASNVKSEFTPGKVADLAKKSIETFITVNLLGSVQKEVFKLIKKFL